jgi:GntR family transcriptional regulator/MocR family aminotransferase
LKAFILSEWLQQYFSSSGDGPAYSRLYDLICRAILEGHLAAGARLPSSRSLAADLGIARNTVLQVYEQLTEEGYVHAGVGRGTYVEDISQDLLQPAASLRGTPGAAEPKAPIGHDLSRRGQALLAHLGFSNRQAGAFMPGVPDVREFPL